MSPPLKRLRRRPSSGQHQRPGTGRLALFACWLLALALFAQTALAQGVVLSGRMGDRALLVIDGQPRAVAVGQTVAGVKLLRWQGEDAEIEQSGSTYKLRVGGTPVQMGAAAAAGGSGREVVLAAGPGGHFVSAGSINGKQVRFMVDTGATYISMGRDEAERLGLDLSNARRGVTSTANGQVLVYQVNLTRVRLGDIELANVGAVVMPQGMPMVLLGNSFLSRLQMKRENDVMRLELR
jgi:aspartyl protease family protein